MADSFETNGTWTIERLRGTDTSYLDGSGRPNAAAQPIAIATGPRIQNTGAVGASDRWNAGQTVAANAEILWVVVSDGLAPATAATATCGIGRATWWPIGDVTDGDAFRGPVLGIGSLTQERVASGGTFIWQAAGTPAIYPRGLWIPLDPDLTKSGFTTVTCVQVTAAAAAAGDVNLDMSGCKMIGFPVNFWGTGQLWAPNGFRGS